MPQTAERVLPKDLTMEHALLGAVLINPEVLGEVTDVLTAADFVDHRVRKVWTAALAVDEAGGPVDALTVARQLDQLGLLQDVGGRPWLAHLVDHVPLVPHVRQYAESLRRLSVRRRLLTLGDAVSEAAMHGPEDVEELLEDADRRLVELTREQYRSEAERVEPVAHRWLDGLEQRMARRSRVQGVPTGFRELDELTGGWMPGQLVVLAARPGMGKSALAGNFALAAAKAGIGAGFFTLEMTKEEILQRLVAAEARVPMTALRSGHVNTEALDRVTETTSSLCQLPLLLDERVGLTPSALRARTRRMVARSGVGLIVVDYMQLMRVPQAPSKYEEVGEISRSLKELARAAGVPVIALSQLSRAPEARSGADKRPQLSDLRESGQIEQDADIVLFIYRPEVYVKEKAARDELRGQAELLVAKQRNGPTGTVRAHFSGKYAAFDETDGGYRVGDWE